MTIRHFRGRDNPYREQIVGLMQQNDDATRPTISVMVNDWIVEKPLEKEKAIEKFYEVQADQVLVEEKNGEVRAFFLLAENDQYFKQHIPEYWPHLAVGLAIVKKEYRRKGIAKKLIEYTEDELMPEQEQNNLIWATTHRNKASQGFAQKIGFKQVAKIENDRRKGLHTLIYGKKI